MTMISPNRLWRFASVASSRVIAGGAADAFLVSYPKSGRTWLRFMLANYLCDVGKLDIDLDLHSMFAVLPNFDFSQKRGIPAFLQENHDGIPQILVSHLPYRGVLFRKRPVIFMFRDPRDVLVSDYFHATRHKHRFKGDLPAFLRDSDLGLPKLTAYLNGWAANLHHHRHCIVSYERLSHEPDVMLKTIISFLGLSVDDDAVERAVAAGRFDNMRALEVAKGIPDHEYDRTDPSSSRMREGKTGSFRQHLGDEDLAWIESYCSDNLNAAAATVVKDNYRAMSDIKDAA